MHLNRPGATSTKSSDSPPGLPLRCLYRNALYVPAPKPGQDFLKSSIVNGSASLPFLTAVTIALYTLWPIYCDCRLHQRDFLIFLLPRDRMVLMFFSNRIIRFFFLSRLSLFRVSNSITLQIIGSLDESGRLLIPEHVWVKL